MHPILICRREQVAFLFRLRDIHPVHRSQSVFVRTSSSMVCTVKKLSKG